MNHPTKPLVHSLQARDELLPSVALSRGPR